MGNHHGRDLKLVLAIELIVERISEPTELREIGELGHWAKRWSWDSFCDNMI